MPKPLILIDPAPRTQAMILGGEAWQTLNEMAEVIAWWGPGRMPEAQVEQHLAAATIIIGQTPLSEARLAQAKKLRAVINVKGNWEPNIDYRAAQSRGVYVLSIAPAMAPAVAEACLGFAIDLGRGITAANAEFRASREAYGIQGNQTAYSLYDAPVGLIGYGNLGRALRPLLAAFGCQVSVYDPWLSAGYLATQECLAAELLPLLQSVQYLFILAGVSEHNQGFLNRATLQHIKHDASVVLASRAEVVEFDALVELAEAGQFRAAIDVFPEEPVPAEHRLRNTGKILLSAHRAGGIWASYRRIAEYLIDDVEQLINDQPPLRLQRAEPAQAAVMRSR